MNSKHIKTPTKAKIQGAVEFCEKQGISYHKEDVFRTFDVERTRGYAYLREGASSRRHHNNSDVSEARGRHKIVTPKLIEKWNGYWKKKVWRRALLHGSNWASK